MSINSALVDQAAANLAALRSPDGTSRPASIVIGIRYRGEEVVRTRGDAVLPSATSAGIPVTPGTLFDLASVTKVTSTVMLLMWLDSRGLLSPADPVQRFLPEYRDGTATLADLLTHTAGLSPWWPYYFDTDNADDAFRSLLSVEPTAARGRERVYSDLGFMILGRVVEHVTGTDIAAAFHDVVARPLGLTATYRPADATACAVSADGDWYERMMIETQTPYPVPYTVDEFPGWRDAPLRGVVNDGNTAHVFHGASGHAGLFASIPDLLRIGHALHAREFASDTALRSFLSASPQDPTQALGYRTKVLTALGRTHTIAYHTGFTGTMFAFDPDDDLTVAVAAMRLYRDRPTDRAVPAAAQVVQTSQITDTVWPLIERILADEDGGAADGR